jgi:hypothetical protein
MCHGFSYRDERIEEETESEPEFLNEESSAETELVTDGGDEEDDEG